MSAEKENQQQEVDVERWFAHMKTNSQNMLDEKRIPIAWIDWTDIVDGYSQKGLPAPTREEAEQSLAENFDEIEEELWDVIGDFWDLIGEIVVDSEELEEENVE